MTVKEVSKLTGVSIRTLHYYDEIGLLPPSKITDSGYRLYNDVALEQLQQILLFRQLEFPLKDIKKIITDKDFDKNKALSQQIELLALRKEHLEKLIAFARRLQLTGGNHMDFSVFDTSKMDNYAKKAKEQWGKTDAYKEFEKKEKKRNQEEKNTILSAFMDIFVEFGTMQNENADSEIVQLQVKKLQDYITEHFYHCTNKILAGLGKMYAAGGEFTKNIDKVAGEGCAEFVGEAIEIYIRK